MNTDKTKTYQKGQIRTRVKLTFLSLGWIIPIGAGISIGTIASITTTTYLGTFLGCFLGIILIALGARQWAKYQIEHAPGDLTDWQILKLGKEGVITPFNEELIEPNSYDVCIGTKYARILSDGTVQEFEADETELEPGEFLLAHTIENFSFPDNIKGILQGKSSWARVAVFVEAAGLFDAGFQGTAVLELFNCGKHAVKLNKGDKIAQMSFHRSLPAALPYGPERGNHYQGQEGAQASWLGKSGRIIPRNQKLN